jgi:uncharacterized membrane protein YedE/YeeE
MVGFLDSSAINSIIGGALMSLASTLHLYLNGKITGVSGAIFRCISLSNFSYNFAFITGMIFTSSFIKNLFDPMTTPKSSGSPIIMENPSKFISDLSILGFIIAGFLVGFGAKMANGCTSGHGICGLPRKSKRSFVAISLFMIFGILTATIRYHIPFLTPSSTKHEIWESPTINFLILIFSLGSLGFNLLNSCRSGEKGKFRDILVSFGVGCLFCYGLIKSGMLKRHVVIGFLTLSKVWNYQLSLVLGSAVGINYFTFNFILKNMSRPKFKSSFDLPTNTKVDKKLCLGSAIFGIGWGLGGICPGPAVIAFYLYCPQSLAFFVSLAIGMLLENMFDKRISEIINNI